jgi:hypothetical protein
MVKQRPVYITESNATRYLQDIDPEFTAYVTKHKFCFYTVLTFAGLTHFECFKLYYSYFYSFDMFKAKWTRSEYLR